MSRLFRLTGGAAIASSLLFGATAVSLNPAPATAQVTCWVCVCSGSSCSCAQVVCPGTPPNDNNNN
jgi:hypothetical protein